MECLFCDIVSGKVPSKKIYEDDLVIGILDLYPNGEGHTLIIPKKHYTDYKELPNELVLHIYEVAKKVQDKLESKLHKNTVSFIVNYMDGQVIKHFHLHIIPGYKQEIKLSQDEVYKLMEE